MADLTPDELLTTTRAVRKRLDLTRPVEHAAIEECLQIALQAPTGSNPHRWHWIFVDEPELKTRIADLYRSTLGDYSKRMRPAAAEDKPPGEKPVAAGQEPAFVRMTESVMHLMEHMQDVPVLMVPVQRGRTEGGDMFLQATYWSSLVPAIWSFMLALRARGLGSAWTTLTIQREAEMHELLGIPDGHTHAGVFPIAYTLGTNFHAAAREPAAEVLSWNGWD
jgi:nitroreductase